VSWWEVGLTFAGIPAVLFVAVTALVMKFSTFHVPDGVAAARRQAESSLEAPPAQSTDEELDPGPGVGDGAGSSPAGNSAAQVSAATDPGATGTADGGSESVGDAA